MRGQFREDLIPRAFIVFSNAEYKAGVSCVVAPQIYKWLRLDAASNMICCNIAAK